ncbi:hypothetical protein GCM10009574_033420 [Streptomyces asiaticus]|uniref:Uncharacterized protein n=2 Tax=Streptomyces rhizosphaericus TaxID=114699 RepID=A0ABN1SBZ9_9ACTN
MISATVDFPDAGGPPSSTSLPVPVFRSALSDENPHALRAVPRGTGLACFLKGVIVPPLPFEVFGARLVVGMGRSG